MFHPFFGELALNVAALMAVLLLVVLKLSDWATKKREREIQLSRERAREQHQRMSHESGTSGAPPAAALSSEPVSLNRLPKLPFRIFRWEFLLLTLAAVLLIMPLRMKIKAHSVPSAAPATMNNPASTGTAPVAPATDQSASQLWHTNAVTAHSPLTNADSSRVNPVANESSASGSQPIQFSDGPSSLGQDSGLPQRQPADMQGMLPAKPGKSISPLDQGIEPFK